MSALYQRVTDAILEALGRGVVPWRKPWKGADALPCNAVTRRPYRGVNAFLLSVQPHTDHRWLTVRQANELGGRVRAGEKSTLVVFWKRWEVPAKDADEPPKSIPLLRYFLVFNVTQCEGLGLPGEYVPDEPGHIAIERAELLVRHMPDPPTIREGKSAWYRPSDDLVQVPPLKAFKSAEAYYQTCLHELAHSTGHARRLDRPAVTGDIMFGSGDYSMEELVAELTSAFCCAAISLDNSVIDDVASYIDGWLKVLRSDPKAVVIAAAQAQRAADYIRGVTYT